MAQLVGPPASGPGDDLLRARQLEVRDDGRLALSGRWYGVRGRRFVRPTLTLAPRPAGSGCSPTSSTSPGRPRRPSRGSPLSVGARRRVGVRARARRRAGYRDRPAGPGGRCARSSAPHRAGFRRAGQVRGADADALSRKLAEEQGNQRLREELDEPREAKVEAVAAIARRDTALSKLEVAQLSAARGGRLERARGEFHEAVASARAEREEAIRACQLARSETAEARSERDAAIRASERLGSERAVALRSAERAGLARDDALRTAEEARTETTRVRLERDEATAALELARRDRDEARQRRRPGGSRARQGDARPGQAMRERDKALHAAEQASAEAARARRSRSAGAHVHAPPGRTPRLRRGVGRPRRWR